jgi:hypothetical protein
MFMAMKECVDPEGHEWRAVGMTIAAGSTPVACGREGCDEIGYLLEQKVVDRSEGQPGEELF